MPTLLDNEDVEALLTPRQCVEALEEAYLALGRGQADFRPRSDLYAPTSRPDAVHRLRTMEATIPSLGVAAIRIGSDIVRWYERGAALLQEHVPATSNGQWVGLVLLFDLNTSELLLIFPDGALQRLRVGATSAIAAKHLARTDSGVFALLGAGNQARGALRCMTAALPVREVRVYSPSGPRLAQFTEDLSRQVGIDVRPMSRPEEAVDGADIVGCATNSLMPVVEGKWLNAGVHVGAIEWCELDEEVFQRANVTAVHVRRGDVQNHARAVPEEIVRGLHKHDMQPWMRELPELSEIVSGQTEFTRRSPRDITCFVNNVGCGLQFAALGRRLLDLAQAQGKGRPLPLQWFTQRLPS